MTPPRAATARTLAGRLLLCTALWMATTGSGLQQRVAPPPAGAALPRLAPTVPVAAAAAARALAQSSDQLTQTGQVGGTMTSVIQVGDFAYVGHGTRVVTFDLSRADRPRLVSRGPLLSDRVMDLALAGDHVAALLRRQGLVLLDISRPAEPRLLGQSGPWPLGDAQRRSPADDHTAAHPTGHPHQQRIADPASAIALPQPPPACQPRTTACGCSRLCLLGHSPPLGT